MSSTATASSHVGVYDKQMGDMRLVGSSNDTLMFTKFYKTLHFAAPQFCSKYAEDITALLDQRKEQVFTDPPPPVLPSAATEMEVFAAREIWKKDLAKVETRRTAYVTNKSAIRNVVLGQSDEAMMSKLEEDLEWTSRNMELLYVLDTAQAACSFVQSNHHPLVSARAALKDLIKCHQNSSKMLEFKDKMVSKVKTMELAGVSIKFGKKVTDLEKKKHPNKTEDELQESAFKRFCGFNWLGNASRSNNTVTDALKLDFLNKNDNYPDYIEAAYHLASTMNSADPGTRQSTATSLAQTRSQGQGRSCQMTGYRNCDVSWKVHTEGYCGASSMHVSIQGRGVCRKPPMGDPISMWRYAN